MLLSLVVPHLQNNVRELFFFAVQCLKTTTDDDDPRTANVIEVQSSATCLICPS